MSKMPIGQLAAMTRAAQTSQSENVPPPADDAGSQDPSLFASAMTQAFPLAALGLSAAFGGAALATRLALPKFPLRVALTGLGTAYNITQHVYTSDADTRRSPASPTARLLYVVTSFAMAGAGLAALVNKALYVYPPAACRGALQGAALAFIPLIAGSSSSIFSTEQTRNLVQSFAPTASWLAETSEWPMFAATIASVVASMAALPGAAVLAALAVTLTTIHTGAEIMEFVGSGEMDEALGPAEAALRLQRPLALAAMLSIFVGTYRR